MAGPLPLPWGAGFPGRLAKPHRETKIGACAPPRLAIIVPSVGRGIPMGTRTAAGLEQILEQREKDSGPSGSEWLGQVAEEIGRTFAVQPDEVAILELLPSGKWLKFVLPEKLRQIGSIPLTSTTALAARTARERRTDIVNNFALARHASIFEAVPMGRREGQSIQKIMSAPILRGDQVIGVTQISRKALSITAAGPDFTAKDLTDLQGLNHLLGRFLQLCQKQSSE